MLAIFGGCIWFLVESASGVHYSNFLISYWNAAVRTTFFLLLGVGVPQLKIQLQQSSETVRKLQNLLPVCAWCRRLRDERGCWYTLEEFIESHTESEVTHGICPICIRKYHSRGSIEQVESSAGTDSLTSRTSMEKESGKTGGGEMKEADLKRAVKFGARVP
jgi:hypothetical protein